MKHYISILLLFFSLFNVNAQILVPYRDKNLWGYSDELGNVKIASKYDSVTIFESRYNKTGYHFAKVFSNGKYGLIDANGKNLIDTKYQDIEIDRSDSKTNIIVKNSAGKFGAYNYDKPLIAEEFDQIEFIENNCFLVSKNKKIGVYNSLGQMIIPLEYKQIDFIDDDFKEAKWMVSNEKEAKYITTVNAPEITRQEIYETAPPPPGTQEINPASIEKLKSKYYISKCEGSFKEKCTYKLDGKFGFYDFGLNKKLNPDYDKLQIISTRDDKTYLYATKNNKDLLIDENGKSLIPVDFDELEYRYNTITFTKDNKKGFYFTESQKYLEPKYQVRKWDHSFYRFRTGMDLDLIPVYTDNPKDWYYIGSNGVVFKSK